MAVNCTRYTECFSYIPVFSFFLLAVSVNPCKPTLACLFRAKCRGEMTNKKKMNNQWGTSIVQTGSNGSRIGNSWKCFQKDFPWPYIHNCSFPSSLSRTEQVHHFIQMVWMLGEASVSQKPKLIYVKLWISCAKVEIKSLVCENIQNFMCKSCIKTFLSKLLHSFAQFTCEWIYEPFKQTFVLSKVV